MSQHQHLTFRTFDPLAQAWRERAPTAQDLAAQAEKTPGALPSVVEAYILDEWIRGQKDGVTKEQTQAIAAAESAAADLLGGYSGAELVAYRRGMATIVNVLRRRAGLASKLDPDVDLKPESAAVGPRCSAAGCELAGTPRYPEGLPWCDVHATDHVLF